MELPGALALEVHRTKELSFSNRQFNNLVKFLSEMTESRYKELMEMDKTDIIKLFPAL
jgi:hypothetical protein